MAVVQVVRTGQPIEVEVHTPTGRALVTGVITAIPKTAGRNAFRTVVEGTAEPLPEPDAGGS